MKTGGRGKAGGVKLADTPEEAQEKAGKILGMDIKGHTVHSVLVAADTDIAQEYYLSFLLDRSDRTFLSMCTVEGGMEIEDLATDQAGRAGQDPGQPAHRRRPRQGAGDRPGRPACPRRPRRRGGTGRAAVGGVHRRGRDAGRGQPAGLHRRRPGDRAGRQGDPRRQRRLPAGLGSASPTRRRSTRSRRGPRPST